MSGISRQEIVDMGHMIDEKLASKQERDVKLNMYWRGARFVVNTLLETAEDGNTRATDPMLDEFASLLESIVGTCDHHGQCNARQRYEGKCDCGLEEAESKAINLLARYKARGNV